MTLSGVAVISLVLVRMDTRMIPSWLGVKLLQVSMVLGDEVGCLCRLLLRARQALEMSSKLITMFLHRKLKVPGSYLHVVDMQLYVDMSSLNSDEWHVLKVWYNSQIFSTVDDFVAAWKDGTLKRSQKPKMNDTDWAARSRTGKPRDLDEKAGPRPISVSAKEFMNFRNAVSS